LKQVAAEIGRDFASDAIASLPIVVGEPAAKRGAAK
jgi:hypothetical protein